MTVISALNIGPCPVVIGDLLLSGPEQVQHLEIPAVGDVTRVFPEGSAWSIIGLEQKVNLIGNNCVVAWAGNRIGALTVINELRALALQAELAFEDIEECYRGLQPDPEDPVSLIGWLKTEEEFQGFSFGARTVQAGPLGDIWVAGTGADGFVGGITGALPAAERELVPLERAVVFFLTNIGPMLQAEFHTRETLLHFFGGGYEIATFIEDKFTKAGDITFICWTAQFHEGVVQVDPPVLALKQDYVDDVLLIRSLRFLNGEAEQPEDSHHVILPIGGTGTRLNQAPPILNMNSGFTCHCVLVQWDGPMKVLVRVEYRTGGSTNVIFTDGPGGISLSIEAAFVDHIAQSIERELTAGDFER